MQSATSQSLHAVGVPTRSKSEKRGPPPPLPVPYNASSAHYSSLSRGLTESQALIPGFSDVPGPRGLVSSTGSQVYSRLRYEGETPSVPSASTVGGGGAGRVQPPTPQSTPSVTLQPPDSGEYSHIGATPVGSLTGSPSARSRSLKSLPLQQQPPPAAGMRKSQSHQPISAATEHEDAGGIYSDIDYSQVDYAEVDSPQPPSVSATTPMITSPPRPLSQRVPSDQDYSEVEGASLVPAGGGMDGYSALHGSDMGEIRSTNFPAESPEHHSYSMLRNTESAYSQLQAVDPSVAVGGTFNPYNSMILMSDQDILQEAQDQGETYSRLRTTPTVEENVQDISDHYEVSPQMRRKFAAQPPPPVPRNPSPVPIRSHHLPQGDQRTPEEVASEATFEPEYSFETFYSDVAGRDAGTKSPNLAAKSKPTVPTKPKKPATVVTDPSAPPVPPRRGASRIDPTSAPPKH